MFSFKSSICFLLLLRIEPITYLLGNQGGVAAGGVVDDEIDLDLVLHGLGYDFGPVFDHLGIQHAADHFVKREGFMSQE
jgi:hypothetical protein